MKLTIAGAALAAFAAVAMVSAPLASAGPEDDFLNVIAGEGIDWPASKTQNVIDTGHAVCTDWRNGATLAGEVQDLQSVTDWDDYQTGVFIGAATGAFCPEYEHKLG
jgi:Protein of unknown function (DUF732)